MIEVLSILLPTYNTPCVELVKALHKQALCIPKLSFEIIVLDDGSTNNSTIEVNKQIDNLSHCRYLQRGYNRGRAATRNELASTARFEWLLFVDSDRKIESEEYLRNYLYLNNVSVVYGGYIIDCDKEKYKGNLRYKYESLHKNNMYANERNKYPYKNFCTTNFLVKRDIMLRYPLDERFVKYGYEDVKWGKTMYEKGISILHIDNPIKFGAFENNRDFVEKTTIGMETLVMFTDELRGFSKLIDTADKLKKYHIEKPLLIVFNSIKNVIKKMLIQNKPSIFLFNIYKLGMYLKFSER